MQRYYLAQYVVANTGLIHKFLVPHTVDRKEVAPGDPC